MCTMHYARVRVLFLSCVFNYREMIVIILAHVQGDVMASGL